ncbi:MAG: hydrogenase maturation protease [Burkholderiales bacterium]|nr:hydrogenase maturation protease [Burkholderiales bacterium]
MSRAALLVLAVGNPSRGDDALGPLLIECLQQLSLSALGDVELLTDFQLQIEHALDLDGRQAVLFVDAARPGTASGATLTPIHAAPCTLPASHALSPQAVLQVATQLAGRAPPAWQLAIEGAQFALGEGLSPVAEHHLTQALALAQQWLQSQGPNAASPRTVSATPVPAPRQAGDARPPAAHPPR